MPIIRRTATTYDWENPYTGEVKHGISLRTDPAELEANAAAEQKPEPGAESGGGIVSSVLPLALSSLLAPETGGASLVGLALRSGLAGAMQGAMEAPSEFGDPAQQRLENALEQGLVGFALPLTLGAGARLAARPLSEEQALTEAGARLGQQVGGPEDLKPFRAGPGQGIRLTLGESQQNPALLEGERMMAADPRYLQMTQDFRAGQAEDIQHVLDQITAPGDPEAIEALKQQRRELTPDKGLYDQISTAGKDIYAMPLVNQVADLQAHPEQLTDQARRILGWVESKLQEPGMDTPQGLHTIRIQLGDAFHGHADPQSPLAGVRMASPIVGRLMDAIDQGMNAASSGDWQNRFLTQYADMSRSIDRAQNLANFGQRLDAVTLPGQMPSLLQVRRAAIAANLDINNEPDIKSLLDALGLVRGQALVTARKLPAGGSQTWAQLGTPPFVSALQGMGQALGLTVNPAYATALEAIQQPFAQQALQRQGAQALMQYNPQILRQTLGSP